MRIVYDLIPLILESGDYQARDLVRICRTSTQWLHSVRKLLYACPALNSFQSCYLLAQSLSYNPALLPYIRGLDLQPQRVGKAPTALQFCGIRDLLASVVKLETLHLGGELAIHAERFLNMMLDVDQLRSLHVDGSTLKDRMCRCPSLEWDEVLACKFPSLQTLTFNHIELEIIPSAVCYDMPIQRLALYSVHIVDGELVHLLNEARSLKHLVISTNSIESSRHVRDMLLAYPIESLEFEVTDELESTVEALFDAPGTAFSSLHVLSLCVESLDVGTLYHISRSCPHLVRLSIGGHSISVTVQEWLEFLSSNAMPFLRELVMSPAKPVLLEAATVRGISLCEI